MITIRSMTAADIPLGMALKDQAGWNQTPADWRRFLALEPEGCFLAQWQGQPAGTAAAFVFGTVGWIAMVLVDRALRGRGIATRLMEHALAYLDQRHVQTARLDATPLGRPVYERLGFAGQGELARWEGREKGTGPCCGPFPFPVAECPALQVPGPEHFEALAALDQQVTGTDRRRLMAYLDRDAPGAARVFVSGGRLRGYVMFRDGSRAVQIGPAIALDDETGQSLLDLAWRQTAPRTVFIDIPEDNLPAVRWAQSQGLVRQRRLTRMLRGQPIVERRDRLWASSGPEMG